MESRLQEHLNIKADEYLKLIISEFGNLNIKNNAGEVIMQAEQLISDHIIVVENNDIRLQEKYKKEGIKMKTPLAHGGRTFGDGKIHFYPSQADKTTLEEIIYECESVLIHELFHYFIRPQEIEEQKTELVGVNSFITEGIVDMYARDFIIKHNLFPEYQSNYGRNVLFVKDLLNTEEINAETRNGIAFNASVSDILSISPYAREFYIKFCKDHEERIDETISVKTPFEIYTYNTIENNILEEDKIKISDFYGTLINRSANYQNTADAKMYVDSEAQKYIQSKNQTISKPKTRVKTLPQKTNKGYVNIVAIVIITIAFFGFSILCALLCIN